MDIMINRDLGYIGVPDEYRRIAIKPDGTVLKYKLNEEWKLLKDYSIRVIEEDKHININELSNIVAREKIKDTARHRSVHRLRGFRRLDGIKLNESFYFIRKVDNK